MYSIMLLTTTLKTKRNIIEISIQQNLVAVINMAEQQGWRKMISFGGGDMQRRLQTDRVAMARGRVQEWDVPLPARSAEAIVSNVVEYKVTYIKFQKSFFSFLQLNCYFCNTTGMHNLEILRRHLPPVPRCFLRL